MHHRPKKARVRRSSSCLPFLLGWLLLLVSACALTFAVSGPGLSKGVGAAAGLSASPIPSMASTATLGPTHTPIAPTHTAIAPASTPLPAPPLELPPRVELPMEADYQGINNCAPTTTSMVVNTYGLATSETSMVALQKPNPADVNVTTEEIAASIREVGLQAFVAYNGDIDLVQRLLAAGFPVITEEWIADDGGMGHFRALRGFDREQQQIFYNDTYHGPDRWRSYDEFLHDWKPFNNKYVVPYRAEQEALLRQVLGAQWDTVANIEGLRATSEAQVAANGADGYAWWGLGEALLAQGRVEEALHAFEQALATQSLPWRYLWYRYGYFEALNRLGRYEEVLAATGPTLEQMGLSEDLRYHRAVALRALGRVEEARGELQQALQDNPRYAPAAVLLAELGS